MMMQTADGTTRLAEVSGERAQAEFGARFETTFDRWLRNLKLRMPPQWPRNVSRITTNMFSTDGHFLSFVLRFARLDA